MELKHLPTTNHALNKGHKELIDLMEGKDKPGQMIPLSDLLHKRIMKRKNQDCDKSTLDSSSIYKNTTSKVRT